MQFELYKPTIARAVPWKTAWALGWASRLRTTTSRRKARLHQTEHPNALHASWCCPVNLRALWEGFFTRNTRIEFGDRCDRPSYVSFSLASICFVPSFSVRENKGFLQDCADRVQQIAMEPTGPIPTITFATVSAKFKIMCLFQFTRNVALPYLTPKIGFKSTPKRLSSKCHSRSFGSSASLSQSPIIGFETPNFIASSLMEKPFSNRFTWI